MGGDARAHAFDCRRDLYRAAPSRQEPPKARRRRVTQNRARTAGEHGRSGARDRVTAPRTDAIDTLVDSHPHSSRQPSSDQALADPKLQELPPSHMPVLTPRPLQNLGVEVSFEAI